MAEASPFKLPANPAPRPKTRTKRRKFVPYKCPSCSSCYDRMRMPRVVRCGHSICSICLLSVTTPDEDILCTICKIPYTKNDTNFPYNYTLMSIIEQFDENFYRKSGLDKTFEHVKKDLMQRSHFLRTNFPHWRRQYYKVAEMQMTLSFWGEELKAAEDKITNIKSPEILIEAFKKASGIMLKINGLLESQDALVKSEIEDKQTLVDTSMTSFVKNTMIMDTLHACPNKIFTSSYLNEKLMYFPLTSIQDIIHVHSCLPSEEVTEFVNLGAKVIETQLDLSAARMLFLDITFIQSDKQEKSRRVYIKLGQPKNYHQQRMISLFAGERSKTFKGTEIYKEKNTLILTEAHGPPYVYTSVTKPPLRDNERCHKANVECGAVLGLLAGSLCKLVILTHATFDTAKPAFKIGKVWSGKDFLVRTSTANGRIDDCGLTVEDGKL